MRRTISLLLLAVMLAATAVAGCAENGTGNGPGDGGPGGGPGGYGPPQDGGTGRQPTTAPAPDEGAEGTVVRMRDTSFQPSEITVSPGTEVRWVNEDPTAHTVTGEGFDSGPLQEGETFSRTFDEAGTFDYECTIHPGMTGRVIVR